MRVTRAEINVSALNKNILFFKERTNTKICVAVKANAYGHGLSGLIHHLKNVDMLAVATVGEAMVIRQQQISLPILVMSPFSKEEVPYFFEYNLIPFLSHNQFIDEFMKHFTDTPISVHLKIDTGMGRAGFLPHNLEEAVKELQQYPCFHIQGIGTHFACAGENHQFTEQQLNCFKNLVSNLESLFDYPLIKHVANTEGALLYEDSYFDMIRIGLGIYGYPSGYGLSPILSLKSKIMLTKKLEKGQSVSYGATWTAQEDCYISVIPIGYGDGIIRSYQGQVKIDDEYYPIVGRICMDMLMICTGSIEMPLEKDVLIFGDDPVLNAETIAKQCHTISYEIITKISDRVEKIYK